MVELGFAKEIRESESTDSGVYSYLEFRYFDPHMEEWNEMEAIKLDDSYNYVEYSLQPADIPNGPYMDRDKLEENQDAVELDKIEAKLEAEEVVSRILNCLHS